MTSGKIGASGFIWLLRDAMQLGIKTYLSVEEDRNAAICAFSCSFGGEAANTMSRDGFRSCRSLSCSPRAPPIDHPAKESSRLGIA
jgi:hypothetical protein